MRDEAKLATDCPYGFSSASEVAVKTLLSPGYLRTSANYEAIEDSDPCIKTSTCGSFSSFAAVRQLPIFPLSFPSRCSAKTSVENYL